MMKALLYFVSVTLCLLALMLGLMIPKPSEGANMWGLWSAAGVTPPPSVVSNLVAQHTYTNDFDGSGFIYNTVSVTNNGVQTTVNYQPSHVATNDSLHWDGLDDKYTIADNASIELNDGGAIFFLCRPTTFTGSHALVVKRNNIGNVLGFDFRADVNELRVRLNTGTGSHYIQKKITTAATLTNDWHVLSWNYDGGTSTAGLNIYTNGVLPPSQTAGSAGSYTGMIDNAFDITVGQAKPTSTSAPYIGDGGEFRIYNRPGGLTSNEMLTVATQMLEGYRP